MALGLVIPAAGRGERLGATTPKALAPVLGRPMIAQTCRALLELPDVAAWIVLAPPGFEAEIATACREALGPDAPLHVLSGGAERADSVRIGLDALPPNCDLVAVHDAARPCVTPDALRAVVAAARESGAAILATPCADTVKTSDDGRTVDGTVDRTKLWQAQTPQVFRTELLRVALGAPGDVTDEAAAVERWGHAVVLVRGSAENLKITTEADLRLAELILRDRESLRCA